MFSDRQSRSQWSTNTWGQMSVPTAIIIIHTAINFVFSKRESVSSASVCTALKKKKNRAHF